MLCCAWANLQVSATFSAWWCLKWGCSVSLTLSNHYDPTCCYSNSPSIGLTQWFNRSANNCRTDDWAKTKMFNWRILALPNANGYLKPCVALPLDFLKKLCYRRPRGRQPWILQRRASNILQTISLVKYYTSYYSLWFPWGKAVSEHILCKFLYNLFLVEECGPRAEY